MSLTGSMGTGMPLFQACRGNSSVLESGLSMEGVEPGFGAWSTINSVCILVCYAMEQLVGLTEEVFLKGVLVMEECRQ